MKLIRIAAIVMVLVAGISLSAEDKITLTLVENGDILTTKWFEQVIKDFEKTHPDIGVKLSLITAPNPNAYDVKLAMMLSDPNNNADVAWTNTTSKQLFEAGKISALPEIKEWDQFPEFTPAVMKANGMIGDVCYTIPITTDTRGLWYNVNIFKKAGITVPWQPKTWDELIRTCEIIKEKVPGVYPFFASIKGSDDGTSVNTAFMLLVAAGGDLYKDGRWVVESQPLYDSLKFIETIYKKHLGVKPEIVFMPNTNFAEIYPPKQKVAIMLDGSWMPLYAWKTKFPDTIKWYDFAALPTEYGQEPGFATASCGWKLTLSANTKHKAEAIEFMKFIAGKESLLLHTQILGNMVSRSDVVEMKGYPEELVKPAALLKYTHFPTINNDFPAISVELSTAVESVALQKMSPEEAMKTYAENIERLLGKDKVIREPYKTEL